MLLWGLTKGIREILKFWENFLNHFLFPKYCNFVLFSKTPSRLLFCKGCTAVLKTNTYICLVLFICLCLCLRQHLSIIEYASLWVFVCWYQNQYWIIMCMHICWNRWYAMFSSKTYVYSHRINLFVTKCTFFSYHRINEGLG